MNQHDLRKLHNAANLYIKIEGKEGHEAEILLDAFKRGYYKCYMEYQLRLEVLTAKIKELEGRLTGSK
jgi:hypothetical protein